MRAAHASSRACNSARLASAVGANPSGKRARRHAGEPVALFAWLALLALDLERLRGECLARTAQAWWAAHDAELNAA